MARLPMFPLGSVLFPHVPLALRVFEPRYLSMLGVALQDDEPEFGVVLIERGFEVGGGDQRFDVGTVARVLQIGATDLAVALICEGGRRIQIDSWIDDGEWPVAEARDLPELEWRDEFAPLLTSAESGVRRALARASEFAELQWAADTPISDDPVAAAWQLAAMAPLGDMDQLALLRSTSIPRLLTLLIDLTIEAEAALTASWSDDEDVDDQ